MFVSFPVMHWLCLTDFFPLEILAFSQFCLLFGQWRKLDLSIEDVVYDEWVS